jgi:hypothetical protein
MTGNTLADISRTVALPSIHRWFMMERVPRIQPGFILAMQAPEARRDHGFDGNYTWHVVAL